MIPNIHFTLMWVLSQDLDKIFAEAVCWEQNNLLQPLNTVSIKGHGTLIGESIDALFPAYDGNSSEEAQIGTVRVNHDRPFGVSQCLVYVFEIAMNKF